MTVTIARDTCSPLWVIRCAAECSECRSMRAIGAGRNADGLPVVCWLASAGDKPSAVAYAIERGWTVE